MGVALALLELGRMRFIGLLMLGACGSSNLTPPDAAPDGPVDAAPDALSATDRGAAATATATNNALCTAIQPFYWEIGDASSVFVSGSIGTSPPDATTVMAIASASKWLFGGYAIEKMTTPTTESIPFLNFTSGYNGLMNDVCPSQGTIDDCLAGATGAQDASAIGKFYYNGAHLEKLASNMGLGAMKNAELATEVRSQIGTEIVINYSQPQPAGGVYTSADQYRLFLRKLLIASPTPLRLGALLAADTVCTNPATCPTAVSSPIPGNSGADESWHYGLAHWIEDDAVVGDGAFSSAGAFGFYPWVDATRTIYGVLARRGSAGNAGYHSAQCGRLIRKAWVTGVAQ